MEQCEGCGTYSKGTINGLCPNCQMQRQFDCECDGCGGTFRSEFGEVQQIEWAPNMILQYCTVCMELAREVDEPHASQY